ncbi:cysteine-rich receptor-like protein kinase 25 [Silene latifolia]|uniref:cysteine-rich receptor-like protein kinase 25 n=1 Tax=Silene latifolia TaxID=37657 RepID=UPI003D778277
MATQLGNFCSNATVFANGSTYQTNLNSLFRSLVSNVTNNPSGFYSTIVGNPTVEAVYGQYLCRGDQNTTSCHQCVATATKVDLPKTYCPYMKIAVIWYDECMVRYSNASFFNTMDQSPTVYLWNTKNITGNSTRFMEILGNMMNNVIAVRAPEGGPLKKFAVDKANYSIFETIYGLGQCTPDLSPSDCYQCLISCFHKFDEHDQSEGFWVLTPSCFAQYQVYPFFNLSFLQQPPPPPSTVSDTNPVSVPSGSKERNQSFDKFEELPLFKFEKLSAATNNFQESNKLGQGGFGPVYKGTLEDGQEVAIKRLSRTSTQGVEEFMNEVLVISKLQHRNLVRLLGCCVERFERMLIYNYMPNKSLDAFLFDPHKKAILDWKKRYSIIEGICRGLLYLHRDSHLKIIHRDLKAANILLDENLNPKISDFGMARIFGGTQIEADTTRVVGTYGYMPPEYAIEGRFSEKSDVFSFGVLLLEIITGKKTRWFDESSLSLLGYVWKQWNEDNDISVIDPIIAYQGFEAEISKCIHVGLLCVQEYAQDRPDISDVIVKLGATSTRTFQKPKQPGFTRFMRDTSTSTQSHLKSCTNDLSITNISGR